MNTELRHGLIRRYRVRVHEWDRADHAGETEPWETMRVRLLAELPRLLNAEQQQRVADEIEWWQDTAMDSDRRRVTAAMWTVPVDVPADVAARIDGAAVDRLQRVVTYEPITLRWTDT